MKLSNLRWFNPAYRNRSPQIPLRLVLTLPFLLLTAGATGLVSYLHIRNGQAAVTDLAHQLMSETTDRVDLYLSTYLKVPQRVNRLNANAVRLGQIDIADPENLKRHFVQQIQVFDSVSRIHFSYPQGGYVSTGNDERGLSVASTNGASKGTLQVHAVDQQGNRKALLVEQPNYDASQRPFYQRAVEAGQPVWTSIYIYVPASRGLGISASYPLYDATNRLQGVLSSDLTLTAIHHFLEKLDVSPNGTVFIMERSGAMVASSTAEIPFNDKTEQLKAIESQELSIRLSTQHLTEQFGDLARINAPTQLQFEIEGKQQFLQVMPFKDQLGLDWLIVVTVPKADFMNHIAANTRNTIGLSAAALVSAILLGLLLADWIARSIQRLSRASHALAQGEWTEALQENSPIGELQVLSHSFHQTAQQLQQSFERARKALQDSEEKYTRVFRICPDAIGIVTLDGRYIEVNDTFVELFGYSREEVVGRKAIEIGHWVNPEERERYVQLAQAGEPVRDLEFTFRSKAGKLLTVLFSAESIEIQGQPYLVGIAKDITDRKQAEEALRQNEARFQQLADASPGIIYTVEEYPGRPVRFEYLSPAFEEIQEIPVAAAMENASLAFEMFHPDDVAGHQQAVIRALEHMQPFQHEWRLITPSGKVKWVQANSRPERRENGVLVWHGVMLDITDRKQAEEALRQSEARYQRLAAAAPGAIYTLVKRPDGSFYFEYVSPAIEAINELTVEQMLQEPTLTLIHPDDQVGYNTAVAQSAATLEAFSHEFRIITPSGKLKWLYASSRPEQRENGEIAWYGIVLDVSNRKFAEAALRQSEERTRAILLAIPDLMKLYSVDGIYLDSIKGNATYDLIPDDASLIGKHLSELIPPEIATKQLQLMKEVAETGEVYVYEQQLWFQDTFQYEEVRVVPCGSNTVLLLIRDITDRKQAEEALRHSEAALRRAQQVAHIGSWEVDVQTESVFWSEESFHIFGWNVTQPEPNLTQFYQLIHSDDRFMLQQAIAEIIANGGSYKTEFRILHPDGIRYVEARGEAVRNEQGQVVQLLGTNLDITERQQAEEALRLSEATKNQILKAIPDLIIWMTADGTCIDLIDGGGINIYAPVEKMSSNVYDRLPPELAQARMTAIEKVMQTGEVQIYEQQFILHGAIRYEEVRVIGVGDDRILVIVRDITDRKQAEAALLDSEARFRSAFWDAPIGMALIGLDDHWLKVNPMLCEMLGYSESELLSMTASSVVHPEDMQKLRNCYHQVQANESRNAQVELRYCCHEGRIAWGMLSLSLVRDSRNQPFYYVAQIQDITKQHAVDQMKNEFISIVSHELRTPLTAIRGFLGLLDTGIYDNKPDKAKHMIGQALENSERLVRLVNDILDLERLSSGRVELVMEVFKAQDLIEQAIAGLQSIADAAKVSLVMVPTGAQVRAAPDAIIQTLTNLLSNAIKFSPANSTVTVQTQLQPEFVLFQVQDQGRGIPANKLEMIFGRFQQVDVSDARQKGGTGLGLAICQSIVEQHGGNIWAESTLGKGSTFYFTLPLPSEMAGAAGAMVTKDEKMGIEL